MAYRRPLRPKVSPEEYKLLIRLRERKPAQNPPKPIIKMGDRLSDAFASVMGSWRFIIIQSVILMIWVILNGVAFVNHWDPYPFILLNLVLSFQAAYAAPIIMMSQNRQAAVDRQEAKHDYEVNMKAELEIGLLHDKVDLLREQEIVELKNLLLKQQKQIEQLEEFLRQKESSK
ncbi:DUF1003 domain-containing protein [Crocosphaera sp. XPORK-15E]|uniref:DUF1003 domain-containing protein n=1 Tax=Crocosphaera sp. XPORK-15E TaxID=3110247 RepID=UPI002B21DF19|nr:DUF1003 domain-containing protein [Crocosphaera sp. XPORK-15E]MEA5532951.1 DUF1003 domain-containing protein [Crocosphaera sp. XPORK-15E]